TEMKSTQLRVSEMAENLIGSEIIKLAGEIREKIAKGEKIHNFTIGDFNPKVFPIPTALRDAIIEAYQNDETNYPEANGMAALRKSVAAFTNERMGLNYSENEFLISGGARPIIYAVYRTLIDPNDKVVFPVPSWNNNHYSHLTSSQCVMIETTPENYFMPSADELRPHIKDAAMIALCSPLNPTGTVFSKEGLESICDLILEENARRGPEQKPLYLMYDQIYWVLTYGSTKHYDPVSLRPEMRNYTIFIDGISKSFAATGVRVGWAFGPLRVIDKMKSILSHVGAWSPKAEQLATAKFLNDKKAVDQYLSSFMSELNDRLNGFYDVFSKLKSEGFKVNAIAPQAAIYLTVQFDLVGMKTPAGEILDSMTKVNRYILDEAKIALVPFYAFGASEDSTWFRLSVGTAQRSDIDAVYVALKSALSKLL
ncbi:MAG: pyridoxal phosphate-dependent aminotransferase, partial [Flavobacteriales bacterium]